MLAVLHQRRHSYPILSPTYRSHQLLTPLYLERITINQPNYHGYLNQSIQSQADHLNAINMRVKKYGDNGFFLQKDIPIQQQYEKTALSRSDVRPWDQIVPRPMTTSHISNKESPLPFPSQHPCTSHISQFAVFPDTRNAVNTPLSSTIAPDSSDMTKEMNETNQENNCCENIQVSFKKDVSVQTNYSCFTSHDSGQPIQSSLRPNTTTPHIVKKKAFSSGVRIEKQVPLTTTGDMSHISAMLRPGVYRWDVSRSLAPGHQRSMTYPSPSTMFSPKYHPFTMSSMPLSPATHMALKSVNHRVATTTHYRQQFSAPSQSRQIFRATVTSARSDSRSKYARAPGFSFVSSAQPRLTGSVSVGIKDTVIPPMHGNLHTQRLLTVDEQNTSYSFSGKDLYQSGIKSDDEDVIIDYAGYNKVNQATQTEVEDDFNLEEEEEEEMIGLEEVEHPYKDDKKQVNINTEPMCDSDAGSYLRPSTADSFSTYSSELSGSEAMSFASSDLSLPYSKTRVLRRLHLQFPEQAPDLREQSIRTGRRHVINGYHAYYWH